MSTPSKYSIKFVLNTLYLLYIINRYIKYYNHLLVIWKIKKKQDIGFYVLPYPKIYQIYSLVRLSYK